MEGGSWESAVVTTTLLRAMMITTVRAGVMSTVLRAVTLSARKVATATVIIMAARSLTKSRMRTRLTAPEGSEMTGIGMAAVILRLGGGMAPAVTGVLVLLLKVCSLVVNQHPSSFPRFEWLCIIRAFSRSSIARIVVRQVLACAALPRELKLACAELLRELGWKFLSELTP